MVNHLSGFLVIAQFVKQSVNDSEFDLAKVVESVAVFRELANFFDS